MGTYYHLAPIDHTGDLESLVEQIGEEEAVELYAKKWGDAHYALNGHAHMVHLYDTIEEARRHRDDFGGKIYAIDGDALEDDFIEVERDIMEFDHPMVRGRIEAEYIKEVE